MPRYSQYLKPYLARTRTHLTTPGAFLWGALSGRARSVWFWRYRKSLVNSLERHPDAVRVANRAGREAWVWIDRYLELSLSFHPSTNERPIRGGSRETDLPRRPPPPVAERVRRAVARLPKKGYMSRVLVFSEAEVCEVEQLLLGAGLRRRSNYGRWSYARPREATLREKDSPWFNPERQHFEEKSVWIVLRKTPPWSSGRPKSSRGTPSVGNKESGATRVKKVPRSLIERKLA